MESCPTSFGNLTVNDGQHPLLTGNSQEVVRAVCALTYF